MSLAECMHADLRKTGVQVQVINPGFIKTQLTDKNDFKMPFLMAPEDAARRVYEHMNGDSFKLDFPYSKYQNDKSNLGNLFRGEMT